MTHAILEQGLGEDTPWDPAADTVQTHYSGIMLHRKCPEAWYFRTGLGLGRPIEGPAPYLHLGSWYGLWRTAEALERGRAAGSLIFDPRTFRPVESGPEFDQATLTAQDVMDAAQAWWDRLSDREPTMHDAWMEAVGGTVVQRLREMTVRWLDEFGEEAKIERPLGLEVFWKRELPRPWEESREPGDPDVLSLPKVVLIGFIDELLEHPQRGVIVRDNKSTSKMETMSAFRDMSDSQLSIYAWGVTPALKARGMSAPRAISFDRILSKATAKPSLNMDGTISSKSKIWDLRTYLDWVNEGQQYPGRAKDGSGAGVYRVDDEIVRRLSQPQWKAQFIQRTIDPITRPMIRAHLLAAVDTATDIWRTQRRAAQTGEAARNLSDANCRWCDFSLLCRARMFGGTDESLTYDLREYGLVSKKGHLLTGTTITRGEEE
jgi:hypothetical protein